MASRTVCRQTLEVGAQCGSTARWELSGGRGVTRVPTGNIKILLGLIQIADSADTEWKDSCDWLFSYEAKNYHEV